MKTWQELSNRVRELEREHLAWENDDAAPTVEFQRREVKVITQKLDREWSLLCDEIQGGVKIEEVAYSLVLALDEWSDEVDKFRDDHHANPGGSESLWKSWQKALLHAQREPRPIMLESISYLARVQKVTPVQIAKIYHWKDEFNQPDTRRVLSVIESGEDIPTVSPHYLKMQEELREKWEKRQSRKQQNKAVVEKPIRTDPIIAPESIALLLEQGVPSKQIARMKNVDQQTVIDYAREIGVPVDGQAPNPSLTAEQHLTAVREKENEQLSEAKKYMKERQEAAAMREANGEINTYQEIGNYKEQVRQMAFDGCTKNQIVTLLKEQYPDKCKPSSVSQIMAAMEREAAANGE